MKTTEATGMNDKIEKIELKVHRQLGNMFLFFFSGNER